MALAIKLADELKKYPHPSPIRVRVSSRAGLGLLLSEAHQKAVFGDQITPFGMLEEACNAETLERKELDALAKEIHRAYLREEAERAKKTGKPNPTAIDWDDLLEDFKNSNRHAADHIEIKLHAIGCHCVPQTEASPAVTDFTKHIELLAKMEHARFCAERFLANWSYAPGPKDNVRKTNPTLVPWDDLLDDEKEKDRTQVHSIPTILGAIKRKARR